MPATSAKKQSKPHQHAEKPAPDEQPLRRWLLGAAMALFVARPLWPSESAAWRGDGIPAVMGWLLIAVVFFLSGASKGRISLRWKAADAAFLVLVLVAITSAARGVATGAVRPSYNMLWEWAALGVGYFLIRQLARTPAELRALVVVMIGLAAGLALAGLYQYAIELPAQRAEYQRDPDAALKAAGMWYPPDSRERGLFEQRLASTEPLATFALTNSLAGVLLAWLLMLAGITLNALGNPVLRTRVVVAALVAGVPLLVCLLLTKSRSAYVAGMVGCTALGLSFSAGKWLRPRWLLVGAGSLVLLVGVLISVGGLDQEVLSEAPKSLGYRLQYWQSTWDMIREHPLLGVGPGNFGYWYTRYKLPTASEEVADPHNLLLEVWATTGIVGAIALVATLLLCVLSAVRHKQQASGTSTTKAPDAWRSWAHVPLGGLAGILLAFVLAPVVAVGPSLVDVLAVTIAMLAVTVLLSDWIGLGALPATVPAIALSALCINLLAAGGIGFPAVAGSLWFLCAVTLGTAAFSTSDVEDRILSIHRPVAIGGALAATLVAIGCHVTAYRPVIGSYAEMDWSDTEPQYARGHLVAATECDPVSPEAWRRLAALEFARWEQSLEDQGAWQGFQRCQEQLLAVEPHSSANYLQVGDWQLAAYRRTNRPQMLKACVEAYRRAAELYPNSALRRASLSVAYDLQGDRQAAQAERARALELDELTPHVDQKLPDELRNQLLRIDSRQTK